MPLHTFSLRIGITTHRSKFLWTYCHIFFDDFATPGIVIPSTGTFFWRFSYYHTKKKKPKENYSNSEKLSRPYQNSLIGIREYEKRKRKKKQNHP